MASRHRYRNAPSTGGGRYREIALRKKQLHRAALSDGFKVGYPFIQIMQLDDFPFGAGGFAQAALETFQDLKNPPPAGHYACPPSAVRETPCSGQTPTPR